MNSRIFIALIAGFFVISADETSAQGAAPAAAAASPVVIPQIKCVKPVYPGKMASNNRFAAFKKELTDYGACVKQYVDSVNEIVNAAAAAVNAAIDDYKKFNADLKAQDEAAKD
jgi:hypothetical protein